MKIRHTLLLTGSLLALTLLLGGCSNFLREEPKTQKAADDFWKTRADADSGVEGLYLGGAPYVHNIDLYGGWSPKASMYGGLMSGLFVDKRKDRAFSTSIEAGTFNIPSVDKEAQALWTEYYIGVSRANFVISNIPEMSDVLDKQTLANYLAQGYFFRALNYFALVKDFGDVPWISEPYKSPEGIYVSRTDAAQIYSHIEADLLKAIEGDALPTKTFYDNGGHVSKGLAQTLLAQVYLQWAGAPLDQTALYAKAAEMAERVITSGVYALEQANGSSDGLSSAFNILKTSKSSREIIYAKEYDQTSHNSGSSYHVRSIGTEAFQWKEGKGLQIFKPGGDVLYNAYLPADLIIDSYAKEDIRGKEKQIFFHDFTDAFGGIHHLNNVGIWSWFDEAALRSGQNSDLNIPMIRYAEVLLIAAEGFARSGNETKGRLYLNQVRRRAGLPASTASGQSLIEAILTERLHEMPVEFKVWDDIRRTRLYPQSDGLHSGKLRWVALQSAKIQNKPKEGTTSVGTIPDYALLWPIPTSEIAANSELTQNPGWK